MTVLPLGRVRVQFALHYAVVGSFLPILAVVLRDRKGFSDEAIGWATALTSLATILAPVLVTLLADTRLDSRRLLAGGFALAALALVGIGAAEGVGPILFLYFVFSVAHIPLGPLQDGLFFSLERAAAPGRPTRYAGVRLWGTVGFLLPSLALYALLRSSGRTEVALFVAAACAAAGAANAIGLPPSAGRAVARRLPSRQALEVLVGPESRWLCLALFLGQTAATAFFTFYPLYLRERVGVEPHLIGLVFGVGVLLEVGYLLALDRLRGWLGLRGLLLVGAGAQILRLVLLIEFPSLPMAVFVQVGHGLEVLYLFVLPVLHLDRLAGDEFRNSIQGVFLMTVGVARVVGGFGSGYLAAVDLTLLMRAAAVLACLGLLVLLLGFRPEARRSTGR